MSRLMNQDDYNVYRALLLARCGRGPKLLVISEQTHGVAGKAGDDELDESRILRWQQGLQGLGSEAASDLIAKEKESGILERQLVLPFAYVLLPDAESQEIWAHPPGESRRGEEYDGWKVFRSRYPGAGGVVTFSRIGFNQARNQAVLESGFQADWLAGRGELVVLNRTGGDWEVGSSMMLWIS